MTTLRTTFHRDVDRLGQDLQAMGDLARTALARATRALTVDDQALCASGDPIPRRGSFGPTPLGLLRGA